MQYALHITYCLPRTCIRTHTHTHAACERAGGEKRAEKFIQTRAFVHLNEENPNKRERNARNQPADIASRKQKTNRKSKDRNVETVETDTDTRAHARARTPKPTSRRPYSEAASILSGMGMPNKTKMESQDSMRDEPVFTVRRSILLACLVYMRGSAIWFLFCARLCLILWQFRVEPCVCVYVSFFVPCIS